MRRILLLLLLAAFFLPLSSCNTGDDETVAAFNFSALYDSLKGYDSVVIVVKNPSGDSDIVFAGRAASAAALRDRPAPHYHGGVAIIVITGFDASGDEVYLVRKDYDGKKTTTTVPVIVPDARLSSEAGDILLHVGEAVPLPAVHVSPPDLEDTTLAWTAGSDAFLIDQGKVKGWHAGTGALVATLKSDTSKHLSFRVEVRDLSRAPESLLISPRKAQLAAGGALLPLSLAIVPNSASSEVVWGVLDTGVARITQLGVLTGVAAGTTKAWVKSKEDGNIHDTIDVEVAAPAPVTGVAFSRASLDLFVGGAAESLQVTVTPPQANQAVLFDVAGDSLVTLADGRIRGIKAGIAVVVVRSAEDANIKDTLEVTVNAPETVSGVKVSPKTLVLYTGGADSAVAAEVTGASGPAAARVLWHVAPSGFAAVDSTGKVSPLAAGSCKVYAVSLVDSTRRDSAAVTVKRDMPRLDVGIADTAVTVGQTVHFHPVVTQEYGKIVEFRWDLDGDGKWDGTDSVVKDLSYSYSAESAVDAKFRVRDGENNDTIVVKHIRAVKGALVVILTPRPGTYTNKSVYDSVQWTVNGANQSLYTSEPLPNEGPDTIVRVYEDPATHHRDSASVVIFRDTKSPDQPLERGTGWSNTTLPTWLWKTGGNGGAGFYRYHFGAEPTSADPEISDSSYDAPSDLAAGSYTLYVQERDKAMNWSKSAKLVLHVDLTAPPAPVTSPLHNPYSNTSLRPVFKWISGANGGGAAHRYRVTFDTSKGGTLTPVDTNFYAPDKDLPLGFDTLWVQERDSAYNWSAFGTVRVRVSTDVTPPSAPVFYSKFISPVNGSSAPFAWRTGGGGGAHVFRVRVDNPSLGGAPEISDTAYTATGLSEGSHRLYVQERDSAANWSDSAVQDFVVATRRALGMTGVPAAVKTSRLVLTSTGDPILFLSDSATTFIRPLRYNGGSWDSLKPTNVYDYNSFAVALDKNDRAYLAAKNGRVDLLHQVDTGWLDLGTIPVDNSYPFDLTLNSKDEPYVALGPASNGAVVYHRSGNTWEQVGNSFSNGVSELKLAFRHDTGFVALIDPYGHPIVYHYDGTYWQPLGNSPISIYGCQQIKLAFDGAGTPYVGFLENTNSTNHLIPRVYKLNAQETWTSLGNSSMAVDSASSFGMAVNSAGQPFIGYNDKSGGLGFLTWNGVSWGPSSQPLFPASGVQYVSVTLDRNGVPVALIQQKLGTSYYFGTPLVFRASFDP